MSRILVTAACMTALFVPQIVALSDLRHEADRSGYTASLMMRRVSDMIDRRNREVVTEYALMAFQIEGLDWGIEEAEAMAELAWRESRFNHKGQNPRSTAYGLYQFLDSTWKDYGIEKTDDPLLQTIAAVRYIEDRHGTPQKALAFHDTPHLVNGRWQHYY